MHRGRRVGGRETHFCSNVKLRTSTTNGLLGIEFMLSENVASYFPE